MKRQLVASGSPYERKIGFSRAVRVGNIIAVSGTAPIGPDGETVGPGDAYLQTIRCLETIKTAITEAGGSLEQVIRTRTFITDTAHWQEIARAHGEFFGDIRPASTVVAVKGFLQPEWLVEFEADCVIED